jgi:tetratricopeptide (TPR) repeat protein
MSLKRKMSRRKEAAGQLLEIVHGPMPQSSNSRFASEIREATPRLHALLQDDPRAAVTELRRWIEREPLPMFYNWLSTAYSALGEKDAVDELVHENYRRNPHYLFARVNYAELCIADGDLAGAREALGDGFDIRRLLRGRKRVHISELTGYYYAVGLYHLKAGDLEAARRAYELLKEAAPDEPPTGALRAMLRWPPRDIQPK